MNIEIHKDEQCQAFDRLLAIMAELRKKCPWDQKQTMESLRNLTIEETFELSEAILAGHISSIKEELGDLLLHIVLYACIAAEKKQFTITTVIQALCEKLIQRHPHVYGKEQATDTQAVSKNWAKIKLQEKDNRSILEGVPKSLPSLIKAIRIQEKVRMTGLYEQKKVTVARTIQEAMTVLIQTTPSLPTESNTAQMQDKLGDLLFSLVNYARLMQLNPEEALEKANRKFIYKVRYIEEKVKEEGKHLLHLSSQEVKRYWQQAKQQATPS